MTTLLLALGAFVAYLIAYNTYGRWLGAKIFRLDNTARVPSSSLQDDQDFVPTKRSILFGHHFTSIAGTGPIVGPAVAVIWGWVPALLWVLFGSIFIGAVHDMGSLVVSMRNRGQTVGDIAGRVLVRRARILFLCVLFLALTIVLAIFGLVIAAVFRQYPESILPCLVQIPLAILIGVFLHRRGAGILMPSLVALGLMYLSVAYGDVGILGQFNDALAAWPIVVWVGVLLIYSYVASVLPVWTLLQPRDYINSLQLLSALGLIVVGLGCAAIFGLSADGGEVRELEIVAPAFRLAPEGAPPIFPFLFITIACGAISGFHCLVSSGTSSKQIIRETDARAVGYGSMLTEGMLATLVILACVAGLGLGSIPPGGDVVLTGEAAYAARYSSWAAADGLAAKVGAFVDGSANFLMALGLSAVFAKALMGVFVASFAATTLDTACRLQRYVTQELAGALVELGRGEVGGGTRGGGHPLEWLRGKHGATLFAIVVAGTIAAMPAPGAPWEWDNLGRGGLILWPLFGATNQLLAGMAFLVIAFWLRRRGLPIWFMVPAAAFMLFLPGLAMGIEIFREGGYLFPAGREASPNWLLAGIGLATLVLEVWILWEAARAWPRVKGVLEEQLAPLPPAAGVPEGARSC